MHAHSGVLAGMGDGTAGAPVLGGYQGTQGPPNSFFTRNRKNKYISIFSTTSRDSTGDSLHLGGSRRVRAAPSEGGDSAGTPSAAGGGGGPRGAGYFGPAAAAYAASAGMAFNDEEPEPCEAAEHRKRLSNTRDPATPRDRIHSPKDAVRSAPDRHVFEAHQLFAEQGDGAGGGYMHAGYAPSSHVGRSRVPSSTLSHSATVQTAHSPLGCALLASTFCFTLETKTDTRCSVNTFISCRQFCRRLDVQQTDCCSKMLMFFASAP